MMTEQLNNPESGTRNISEDPSAVFLNDSSLQSPEEFEKDKHGGHRQEDNKVTGSVVDDLQLNSDGAAGTMERKSYGDTELNKGLESQAMDEES